MSPSRRRVVQLVLTVLGLLLGPMPASAFCRTTTIPVVADFQPRPDRCWTQGLPLYWKNACVSYSIQRGASRQIGLEDAANSLSTAFTRWTGASCPTGGAGQSRVSIDVRDLGPVDCAAIDYSQTGANQNVIVFRDDVWPHADSNNTLALTTITFNPDTGEIYDGDMEINTADVRVTLVDPVPPDGYDFGSIVTHETGHFLGLAHSGDPGATMFASYQPGNTAMRNLTSDDVAGICEVYRPDGTRATLADTLTPATQCDPTPRRGFTVACAEQPAKSCLGNARIAAAAPMRSGWLAVGVSLVVAASARRRRRGKHAAERP